MVEVHEHFLLDHGLSIGSVHMSVGIQNKHIELRQRVDISINVADLIGKLLNCRVHTNQFTLKHIDDKSHTLGHSREIIVRSGLGTFSLNEQNRVLSGLGL